VVEDAVCAAGWTTGAAGAGPPSRSARATSANIAKPAVTAKAAKTLARGPGRRTDINWGFAYFKTVLTRPGFPERRQVRNLRDSFRDQAGRRGAGTGSGSGTR